MKIIELVLFLILTWQCKILGSESFTRWLVWGASTGTRDSASSGAGENRKVFFSVLPTST